MANTYVTKAELLTILTRLFNIKVSEDKLNVWTDLKSWNLKAIADTVKKYNLYPFENLKKFNGWEVVSRLTAFETLYRFIIFKPEAVNIVAAEIDNIIFHNQIEKTMEELFDF